MIRSLRHEGVERFFRTGSKRGIQAAKVLNGRAAISSAMALRIERWPP
jgi:hypothetical protein